MFSAFLSLFLSNEQMNEQMNSLELSEQMPGGNSETNTLFRG
jgi:hypothetical protein